MLPLVLRRESLETKKSAQAPMHHAEADRTQLEHACAELLKSEETYLEILECIVGIFQKPLRAWAEEEEGLAVEAGLEGVALPLRPPPLIAASAAYRPLEAAFRPMPTGSAPAAAVPIV